MLNSFHRFANHIIYCIPNEGRNESFWKRIEHLFLMGCLRNQSVCDVYSDLRQFFDLFGDWLGISMTEQW